MDAVRWSAQRIVVVAVEARLMAGFGIVADGEGVGACPGHGHVGDQSLAEDELDIGERTLAVGDEDILGGVRGFQDLDPTLLGRVEELIDFVTA